MKNNFLILACVVMLTLTLGAGFELTAPSSHQLAVPETIATLPNDPAPDFSVTGLNGRHYGLRENFSGKTVLLNFWASWCIPCAAELPRLYSLARLYPDDVVLLAVSSDEDAKTADAFLRRFPRRPKNAVFAIDSARHISQDIFQTMLLPETVIIAPDGTMVAKLVGADWSPEDARRLIDSTLTE
jgi:thiol-disulfide isomerase/thioredoxin